jgi:hypothetical protein
MRPVFTVGGMTLMLALATAAHAQSLPYDTNVAVPEVEVRSGPTMKFYPTNRLRQGDKVTVLKVEGDWLGIKPPAGSCSWIETKSLDSIGPNRAMVREADVKVFLGSTLVPDEPSVFQRKFQRGALVVVLEEKPQVRKDGERMVPIEPPTDEVRWIPANAVRASTALVSTSARPNVPATPTANPAPATSPASTDDQMWAEAQQAERAGNIGGAIKLYDELCQRTANSNPNLAMQCANRSHYLRNGWRDPTLGSSQAGRPTDAYYPGAGPDGRLVPRPSYGYGQPAASNGAAADTPPPAPGSYRGYLRRAGFQVDGQATYALEDSRGQPQLYVSGQVGVNLEPYHDRLVEVFGPLVYRADIRIYYMTASNVIPR